MEHEQLENPEHKNKTIWNFVILSEFILVITSIFNLNRKAPTILPDEICVLKRAEYFAHHFEISSCESIINLVAGDPHPLYSIVISPLYWFLDNFHAYYGILLLNALLVTSLMFPLFHIFKKFIDSTKIIALSSAFIVLLPQFIFFEATAMTETIFAVICVWFLYFYMESFEGIHAKKFKIVALILALLGFAARPFGFILVVAMLINEMLQIKHYKHKIKILGLCSILVITAIAGVFLLRPAVFTMLFNNIAASDTFDILRAIIEQINSFSVATLVIPFGIVLSTIFITKNKKILSIRGFIVSFILLNAIISAQHILNYLLDGIDPGMITRYINVSIIYVFILAIIFIFSKKEEQFKFNYLSLGIFMALLTSLFMMPKGFKHSLNPEISFFGNKEKHLFNEDIILVNDWLKAYFIAGAGGLLALLIINKRKILIGIIAVIMLFESLLIAFTFILHVTTTPLVNFFKGKTNDILIATNMDNIGRYDLVDDVWELIGLSNVKIHYMSVESPDMDKPDFILTTKMLEKSEFFSKSNYIISEFETEMDPVLRTRGMYIYPNTTIIK